MVQALLGKLQITTSINANTITTVACKPKHKKDRFILLHRYIKCTVFKCDQIRPAHQVNAQITVQLQYRTSLATAAECLF